MSEQLPDGWVRKKLGQLIKLQGGYAFQSDDFAESGIPIIRISNINNGQVNLENTVYYENSASHEKFLVSCGDVLLAMSGATTGKVGRYNLPFQSYLNQRVGRFQKILELVVSLDFIYQLARSELFFKNTLIDAVGGAQPNISSAQVEAVSYNFPPFQEQKKIASILTSVDELIETTQKQIDKLQDLKKATMNELLTKGIGHTDFKDSELGRIPKNWEIKQYADLVKVVMPKVSLDDDRLYAPVVVRRKHNGVETRGEKHGAAILVKSQFKAVPNTFLISKRQIYHGSCGLVPCNISENAIISKEYIALKTNDQMELRFLNYFSRTEVFQKQIVKTTYGVDEEKFVFKDQWWMKEKIVCPPKSEQLKICDMIDGISKQISTQELRLRQTQSLKKSLMQDLLTGKVRVQVN